MRMHTPVLVGGGQIIWGVLRYHYLPSSFETGVSLMTVAQTWQPASLSDPLPLAVLKLQACAHPFPEGGN